MAENARGGQPSHRRTPVTFASRSGLKLFGILHEPIGPSRSDVGMILLCPGVKMRVGPQRLYLRLATLATESGMPVLRFDCHGLGDSEGVLPEEQLRDVYGQIEVGRFVNDTIDAMGWMQNRLGTQRFLLSGLCGGAITGLLAGERDARVAGLLALGITPLIDSESADPSRYMSAGQLEDIGRSYLRKLIDPRSWLRLLTLQTDHKLLWRAMSRLAGRLGTSGATTVVPRSIDDNASPLFPPAFFHFLATRRPMLLIFGGSDRLKWEFTEKFVDRHGARLSEYSTGYEVHTIEQANHVLSFAEWQDEMAEVAGAWLRTRFRAPTPGPVMS